MLHCSVFHGWLDLVTIHDGVDEGDDLPLSVVLDGDGGDDGDVGGGDAGLCHVHAGANHQNHL